MEPRHCNCCCLPFFDYTGFQLTSALKETMTNLQTMFLTPALNHFSWGEAFYQVGVTLALAVLSTVIGAVIAFFLALLSAENLSNQGVAKVIKTYVAFIRAVPTVLWVLIFAIAAGLGSTVAVLGCCSIP